MEACPPGGPVVFALCSLCPANKHVARDEDIAMRLVCSAFACKAKNKKKRALQTCPSCPDLFWCQEHLLVHQALHCLKDTTGAACPLQQTWCAIQDHLLLQEPSNRTRCGFPVYLNEQALWTSISVDFVSYRDVLGHDITYEQDGNSVIVILETLLPGLVVQSKRKSLLRRVGNFIRNRNMTLTAAELLRMRHLPFEHVDSLCYRNDLNARILSS